MTHSLLKAPNPVPEVHPLLVAEVLDRMETLPGAVPLSLTKLSELAMQLDCAPLLIQPLRLRIGALAAVLQAEGQQIMRYRFGTELERATLIEALAIMAGTSALTSDSFDSLKFMDTLHSIIKIMLRARA